MADMSKKNVESEKLNLYSWGANSYGQLGVETIVDQHCPVQVESCNVRRIFAGGGHSLFLATDDLWYSCGSNSSGQLGLGDSSTLGLEQRSLKPTKLAFSEHGVIDVVRCGWDFTFIIGKHGKIYGCGSNTYGQLGLPHVSKCTNSPAEVVEMKEKVADVACGLRHSVIATELGDVYCCGSGRKGQLGVTSSSQSAHKINTFTKIELGASGKVVQVGAGAYHSAARTDKGEVFVWGNNKHGQLAKDPALCPGVTRPHKIPQQYFNNQPVTCLLSGWTHVLAQTECGSVYSWGRNDYCQLGRSPDDKQTTFVPEVVSFPATPSQLAAGSEHNLAIVGGVVYSWGWNEHGICGTGDELNVAKPAVIKSLENKNCTYIACGAGHSFALTNS